MSISRTFLQLLTLGFTFAFGGMTIADTADPLPSWASDGDLQMLQYTAAGEGPRLMLLLHHTDAEREWAYDRNSSVGKLDKALDEARQKDWTVVDMKRDWNIIFPVSD